jgi:Fic family protein
MLVSEGDDLHLYTQVQDNNLVRQNGLLRDCIEIGLKQGHTAFDKYMLWALNHAAVANVSQFGGRFREEPVYVGHHLPPHFREVPGLMDRFVSSIHENWFNSTATEIAAYGLWRLNWIHPFIEGNGRTARAACYYLLCTRSGDVLPGRKTVPQRIREAPTGYIAGLRAADRAWHDGSLDVSELEAYVARLLEAQLRDVD